MEFDFTPEQQQLKDQVRRYLSDHSGRAAVRAVLDGPQAYDAKLWQGLGELGYLGAAIPEAHGGLGVGYLEACVVAEELGRALSPVPYSSSIALAAECLMRVGSAAQQQRWLPLLASGKAVATVAVAERSGRVTPEAIHCTAKVQDGATTLSGTKLAVADGDIADIAIVLAKGTGGGLPLYLVELAGAGVERSPITTIDPTRSHAQLRFDNAAAERLGEIGMHGQGWAQLQAVYDRAAVLMAFEQLGGADRALQMACAYAQERFAFGRPIGSLQAIKHMLADMYVSATLARSNCYYAAWALSTDAAELPLAAATARVSATQAYQHCARNNIQVHGGMGFTWEFDCHLYYRRANLLAQALGPLSEWEDRLVGLLKDQHLAAKIQEATA